MAGHSPLVQKKHLEWVWFQNSPCPLDGSAGIGLQFGEVEFKVQKWVLAPDVVIYNMSQQTIT